MRRPYIAGNWKMNTSRAEAVELARACADLALTHPHVDVGICVPFPHLGAVADAAGGGALRVGAQDVFWEATGAFTGEVSVAMLADYCNTVIIGHSERRQLFGETDATVNRKLAAVLASSMDPIVCVGESLEQRRAGATFDHLGVQLRDGFAGIEVTSRITIAYEPIWAIGTGETATLEIAQEACAFIRSELEALAGNVASEIRIQYGGSVNPQNAASLLGQPDIDGALVGGASLKAEQFSAIVAAVG
jgi:triosephosphate isomerase